MNIRQLVLRGRIRLGRTNENLTIGLKRENQIGRTNEHLTTGLKKENQSRQD
jgi:hypothetical protein